jgi:hypothetical protein
VTLLLLGLILAVGGYFTYRFNMPPYLDVYLYNEVDPAGDLNDPNIKMTLEAYNYHKRFPNASANAVNRILQRRQVEEQISDWKLLHPGKPFRGPRIWSRRG